METPNFTAGSIPEKAIARVAGRFSFEPGEHVILFYNLLLFRFGAAGFVFTSKRVVCYDDRDLFVVSNSDVKSITFDGLDKKRGVMNLTVGGKEYHLAFFSKDYGELKALLAPYVPVEPPARGQDDGDFAERARVLEALFAPGGPGDATLTLDVPVHLPTGGGQFAKKVLFGLVTGGVGAATESRYTMDVVHLPPTCLLCGVLKGTKVKTVLYAFRQGSGWSSLGGVNPNAVMQMSYALCELCAPRPEAALKIVDFRKDADKWLLTLKLRNPDVGKLIGELNVVTPNVAKS